MQPTRTCAFPGCEQHAKAKGLCKGHWRQQHKGKELRPLRPNLTLEERFWLKVGKGTPSGCWEWTASINRGGYGMININRRPRLAHRVSWEFFNGPIPEGMVIDHRCANPSCVNPAHLRPVTPSQNQQHRIGGNKNSTSVVRGVYWVKKRNAWEVQIKLNGRRHWGGRHSTIEAASAAAKALRAQLYTHDDHDEWLKKQKESNK